ncbi:conserved hypothetical protein [Paraburkholderia ribeironis]|uniref:Uncharacterized protein n=1 Tax=Paraburkholderia ribeironis TaxID=1247936 RepID=A0A1N7S4F2_9BURK|nr:hypothetical protein [Paraburkholderia ribeironis]SIT42284.1 conserved hypothetical protein [Paraburkholderia ribeironis]
MSSHPDKNHPFETGLPALSTPERGGPSSSPDAAAMYELQRAAESVLQLATQTHAAVARSDTAGAQVLRASLEKQLTWTTRLIDEMLFGGTGQTTMH